MESQHASGVKGSEWKTSSDGADQKGTGSKTDSWTSSWLILVSKTSSLTGTVLSTMTPVHWNSKIHWELNYSTLHIFFLQLNVEYKFPCQHVSDNICDRPVSDDCIGQPVHQSVSESSVNNHIFVLSRTIVNVIFVHLRLLLTFWNEVLDDCFFFLWIFLIEFAGKAFSSFCFLHQCRHSTKNLKIVKQNPQFEWSESN